MCHACKTNPVYELPNKRKFCEKCFCRYFEKKVLNTIRKYSLLDNTEKIFVVCKTARGKAIFNILSKIGKKRGMKISKIESEIPTKKYEKLAIEDSLDDAAFLVMLEMMNKSPDFSIAKPEITRRTKQGIARCIKPLYFCLDKEIYLYSKIKGIKGRMQTKEKNNLKLKAICFVNSMEKRHPEIKNAIVNSFLGILPILKENKKS